MSSNNNNINNNNINHNNNEQPSVASASAASAATSASTAASSTAAAAAATTATNDTSSDDTIAQSYQTIQHLTSIFQFTFQQAEDAINAVGADVTLAYNYILDQGGEDKGGPIYPKSDCPHVQHCVNFNIDMDGNDDDNDGDDDDSSKIRNIFKDKQKYNVCNYLTEEEEQPLYYYYKNNNENTKRRKSEVVDGGRCPDGENWICLQCHAIRCSRYVNGHCREHWKNTKDAQIRMMMAMENNNGMKKDEDGTSSTHTDTSTDNNTNTDNNNNTSIPCTGHCIAMSLEDLSVWCYECNAYLIHDDLTILVQKFEKLKFDTDKGDKDCGKDSAGSGSGSGSGDDNKSKGQEMDSNNQNDGDDGNDEKMDEGEDEQETTQNDNNQDDEMRECGSEVLQVEHTNSQENNNETQSFVSEQDSDDDDNSDDDDDDNDTDDDNNDNDDSNDEGGFEHERPHPYLPHSIRDLANFIKSDHCRSIVILAGAGMSVASGIPDFRSVGGLYDTIQPDQLTATELQRELIRSDPTAVFDKPLFIENQLPCLECKRPFILGTKEKKWKATLAHRFVELLHEKTGKLTRLYTQNIDGLERQCTMLPKELVVPVHGSMDRVACELEECQAEIEFDDFCEKVRTNIKDVTGVDDTAPETSTPIMCETCCNNTVKPTVVLFRSPLPNIFFQRIVEDMPSTDLFIVMGTSLTVGPANSLVQLVPDDCLRVVVNNEPVGFRLGIDYSEDATRDYFARGSCDGILLDLMDEMDWFDDIAKIRHDLPDSCKELLDDYLGNTK